MPVGPRPARRSSTKLETIALLACHQSFRAGVRARARVGVGVRVRRRVRSSDRVSSSDHRVARPYVGSDPNP